MNELRRTLEDAFTTATDKATRERIGKALDMMDTMEMPEILAKVERVKHLIADMITKCHPAMGTTKTGLDFALYHLQREFPDASVGV